MKQILILLSLLISVSAQADFCSKTELESMATLHKGRVKPFKVAAEETLKGITDKKSFNGLSATKIICQMGFSEKTPFTKQLPVVVSHVDVKKLLGLKKDEKTIFAEKLLPYKESIRSEIMRQKRNTSYKKSLNRLWFKLTTYENTLKGAESSFYNTDAKEWRKFSESILTQDFTLLIKSSAEYKASNKNTIDLEYKYSKSYLVSISMLVALMAIFFTVLIKKATIGHILSWLVIILETSILTIRVLISGRAPITNMYETVLFSGFGALFIALILFIVKKDKTFLLGGLGYNILCLFMMKFSQGMLNESISPLVPVLRDNFWLSTHVTTIILSYAALALSWLIANITLFKYRFTKLSNADYRYYEGLNYAAIKIGVVLLAAGIILGGVWADYSWGRFWGWDPKETWSLIVLLFYMVILHGKSTTWINTHRFMILSAAGFMTVMMAWFGVNYILASGLHSYGFSEGGAIFLGSFFAIQTVFLIIVGIVPKKLVA